MEGLDGLGGRGGRVRTLATASTAPLTVKIRSPAPRWYSDTVHFASAILRIKVTFSPPLPMMVAASAEVIKERIWIHWVSSTGAVDGCWWASGASGTTASISVRSFFTASSSLCLFLESGEGDSCLSLSSWSLSRAGRLESCSSLTWGLLESSRGRLVAPVVDGEDMFFLSSGNCREFFSICDERAVLEKHPINCIYRFLDTVERKSGRGRTMVRVVGGRGTRGEGVGGRCG